MAKFCEKCGHFLRKWFNWNNSSLHVWLYVWNHIKKERKRAFEN